MAAEPYLALVAICCNGRKQASTPADRAQLLCIVNYLSCRGVGLDQTRFRSSVPIAFSRRASAFERSALLTARRAREFWCFMDKKIDRADIAWPIVDGKDHQAPSASNCTWKATGPSRLRMCSVPQRLARRLGRLYQLARDGLCVREE